MQYVGIDGAYRRAAWCAKSRGGEVRAEGVVPADEDRLAKLVLSLGPEGPLCGDDERRGVGPRPAAGGGVELAIADARKVTAVAPLACKTDKLACACGPPGSDEMLAVVRRARSPCR